MFRWIVSFVVVFWMAMFGLKYSLMLMNQPASIVVLGGMIGVMISIFGPIWIFLKVNNL